MEVEISKIVMAQKDYFNTGDTRSVDFRIGQLKKVKQSIQNHESEIIEALQNDLGKSEFEAYVSEIGFVYNSISHMIKHLKKWAKVRRVGTPLSLQPSNSKIYHDPYGVVLIIGPFNYPFQLTIEPLIGAIAAGNCAVVKPSEEAVHTARIVETIIKEIFAPSYVECIQGQKETTTVLLKQPFDFIFFTGSVGVGKIIMEAASKQLIPVVLELGGKSPAIVDDTANLDTAAKRIVWGKLLNAGQTCIAPDYVLAHSSIKQELMEKMIEAIESFYGPNIESNTEYGRIISDRHFNRLTSIIEKDRASLAYGGTWNASNRYIEPTLFDISSTEAQSMQDELFGPILPVLSFENFNDVKDIVAHHPNPLALYVFTTSKDFETRTLNEISFGGGCVNDTITHIANHNLPFGGVGTSGMGSYHGKASFECFSHAKSVLKKSSKIEVGILFPPYKNKLKLIRKIFK